MKLKSLLLFGFSLVFSLPALANTNRYRIMFNDDPATTITIAWNQVSGSGQTVYYGPVDYGTTWASYPSNATPYRTTSFKGMSNQFVKITGLTPNTPYYFVIKDSDGTSSRYWFKTAPDVRTERLAFIAGGDSRSGTTQRQNSNRMVSKLRPHAVFFGGDLMNGSTTAETQQFLDDWQLHIGADGRMIPLVVCYGNHENYDGDGLNYLYNLYDTPYNGYFAVTFGGDLFRFYTLNTEVYPGTEVPNTTIRNSQTSWLASDLASNSGITWKGAQYHRPMVPHYSGKSDGHDWYNDWVMNFYNYGVRLVVECDAHVVKTTYSVVPTGTSVNFNIDASDPKSITFIGEGTWGTTRPADDSHAFTRDMGSFYGANWIFVDECTIEIRKIETQNPTSVTQVSDSDIFTPPAGLIIWQPTNTPSGVITIVNCTQPITDFIATPTAVFTNDLVTFTDLSANTPTSWAWDFGDGNVSALQNPTHAYSVPGVYNVSLTATNPNGSDTETKTAYITVTNPVAPTADFTADVTTVPAGGTINFTDLSAGLPSSWLWSFPGGTPATSIAQNPTVVYSAPGTYDVTLTAVNSQGAHSETKTAYITVLNSGAVSVQVADGNDDAEEFRSDGSMYLTSSDLELCYDGGYTENQYTGVRFVGVNVPQGATITNAWIQFRADETDNTNLTLYIKGENTDDAQIFTSTSFDISSRATTTNQVNWVNPATWTAGELTVAQQTPNISVIVQEIVSRPGWSSGNAMAFIFTDNNTTTDERVGDSYEGGYGAILNIEYTVPFPLAFTSSITDASCNGVSDGSISLTATGGTPGYQYSVDGGSNFQPSSVFSNLPAGNYNIVVMDATSTTTTGSVTLAQPDALVVNGSSTNTSCNGSATGTASAAASGGAGSFSYSWNDLMSQTTATATGLTAGTYMVTVTDGAGCQGMATVVVNEPAAIVVSGVPTDEQTGNDGAIDLSVSGGTTPYYYDWDNDGTGDIDDTEDLSGLTSGTYSVVVTDVNGCTEGV